MFGAYWGQTSCRFTRDGRDRPRLYKGRGETIFDLAFDETTGKARAYKPAYFADMYDDGQDTDLGLRAGERSIYDIYHNPDGTKRAIQAQGVVRATSLARSPIPATRMVSAVAPSLLPAPPLSATLSQAKKEYLDGLAATHRDGRAEEDAGLVIQFLIDFIGDLSIDRVGRDALHQFEMAMAATPDRTGLPKKAACSPFQRWKYGQEHGLAGLKMLSETRIKNIWHRSLHAWFDWMATKGHPKIDYRFSVVPENPTGSIERDAWTDEEMLKLFSLPLFVGCESADHYWTAGNCFVQNELYWAYLIIFFCGLRNSEIGRLEIKNLVLDGGVYFFDLGTKPRRTQRALGQHSTKGKSKAAARRVPISPLLIDLGLIERSEALEIAGSQRLFPEWKDFKNKKSGRDMPGHHLSKSWQYVKKKFDFVGDELTIYGGRHTRAQWYTEIDLAEIIKRKILGHAQMDVHAVYGANVLTVAEAKLALKTLPIEQQIAGILIHAKLRAEYKEIIALQTW